MYGSEKAAKIKAKQRAVRLGKTYEEIYGEEKAVEVKTKIGEAHIGKSLSEEHIEKLIVVQNRPDVVEKKRAAATGKHHSEETKAKLREINIGKKHSAETIEKIRVSATRPEVVEKQRAALKGVTWEERYGPEKAAKCKENFIAIRQGKTYEELYGFEKAVEMKANISGENHPNYRDGSSSGGYPPEWTEHLRESIRDRDGRVCQMSDCNKTEEVNGQKLDVHHIDYDKENCDSDNLISLCRSCHRTADHNLEYHQQLFEGMILCFMN
jgi:hypothetical protein